MPLRIGDLIVVRWGKSQPGTQLALVTGKSRNGIRAMKWRGSGGWTRPVSTHTDRILGRADEPRLQKAAKMGAFSAYAMLKQDPLRMLIDAAQQITNIPMRDGILAVVYGQPKSGKSSPIYMLRDRVLTADGMRNR